MKENILVIFGGKSSEYEVSLWSAASVLRNIPQDKYNAVPLGITKQGEWFFYNGDIDSIENGSWTNGDITKAALSPDSSERGLLIFGEDGIRKIRIDVIFPVLHGKNGEDGTMQGLFELSGIPYVGCGHLSSAVTMDKSFTNLIADFHNIRQAKWLETNRFEYSKNKEEIIKRAEERLGYPIFVKPACAGSSIGISKAHDRASLEAAINAAFEFDRKIIFEETVKGREIECAVLGNDEPISSVVGEIMPTAEFYDYDSKYVDSSELHIPADISHEEAEKVRNEAVRAYKACDCAGLSRVDFFLGDDGNVYFNEINTIPGFTQISMYSKLFEASGIPYPELIDKLLTLAKEKNRIK